LTCRFPVLPVPGPLEDYLQQFDRSVVSRAQRRALREYVIALLQPLHLPVAGADAGFGAGQGGSVLLRSRGCSGSCPNPPGGHEARTARRGVDLLLDLADPEPRISPGPGARWGSAARR